MCICVATDDGDVTNSGGEWTDSDDEEGDHVYADEEQPSILEEEGVRRRNVAMKEAEEWKWKYSAVWVKIYFYEIEKKY